MGDNGAGALLAILLITTQPKESFTVHDAMAHAPAIVAAAIDLELLTPDREHIYYMKYERDALADMEIIWDRHNRLWNAPHMSDARLIPSYDVVSLNMRMNRAIRSSLYECQVLSPFNKELLGQAIIECDNIYYAWSLMLDARRDFYYDHVRRQALQSYRELVGDEAFFSGQVPPCAPPWVFSPPIGVR